MKKISPLAASQNSHLNAVMAPGAAKVAGLSSKGGSPSGYNLRRNTNGIL